MAEPLVVSLLGLRETDFSQDSRDRLWKLFLEARRDPEVSCSSSYSWSRALPVGLRPGLWPEGRPRVAEF